MKKIILLAAWVLLPTLLPAQEIKGRQSKSEGTYPKVSWTAVGLREVRAFEVFRAEHGSEAFERIDPWRLVGLAGDSITFMVTDTTLTEQGMYQYYIAVPTLEGKVIRSEIMYGHNMGYIAPPHIVNFTASRVADQKAIQLTWKLRNSATVISQALFRSRDFDDGYEFVTRLPASVESYIDPVPRANEPWFYFILIQDFFGYQPPSVRVHGFASYAEKPYAPLDFAAVVEGEDVKLHWRRVGDNIFGYRLYRRLDGRGDFLPVGGPFYLPEETVATLDHRAAAHGREILEYYVVSISDGYLKSAPSDTATILLPENAAVSPPREVDWVVDAGGNAMILWTPADGDAAVLGYNIFRSVDGAEPEKLNSEPLADNFFVDREREYGVIRYLVETVNLGGRASDFRTGVDLERHAPRARLVLSCRQDQAGVVLEWAPLDLDGLKNLHIFRRQEEDEEPVLLSRRTNEEGIYTDTTTTAGTTYVYLVAAEMNDGKLILVNDGVLVNRF